MLKQVFWSAAWLFLSVGAILTSASVFYFWKHAQTITHAEVLGAELELQDETLPSPSPLAISGMQTLLETEDGRVLIVANFLERHDSPLKPYDHFGQVFVELADRNGFDFRLLPAIAMQESNLCKKIPEGSYNCLGFGVHSRGTLKFESYEANFTRAARELKANYIDIGLTTPDQIMRKYTPSSDSWSNSVNQWMAEMRFDDADLGRTNKINGSVLEFVKSPPAQP